MNEVARGLTELTQLHLNLFTTTEKNNVGSWGQPQTVTPSPVVLRPWVNPPEGYVPFAPGLSVALPAVGSIATVVSLTVPDGFDGVVNYWSWNFTGGGFVQGSGDISVQILRNGAPVRNFDNVLLERGTIGIPCPISPIRIWSGQVISIVVNHVANALLNGFVIGNLTGYYYPSQN
jgi:hypothetical protein